MGQPVHRSGAGVWPAGAGRAVTRTGLLLLVAAMVASCAGGGGRAGAGSTASPAASVVTTRPPGTTATSGPTATPAPSATAPGPGPTAATPCGQAGAAPAAYRHVIWIWMENHQWNQVLGDSRSAPYETGLAARCGTATAYSSVGSPSLPNYLGATSGGTWGISDDGDPAVHPLTVDNLFRQVRAAGGTERSYQESMMSNCQLTVGPDYAPRHNPATYYTSGGDRRACQTDDVNLDGLTGALASATLPTFAFVTPNLCHDTHDCAVSVGDAWLAEWLPRIMASPAYHEASTAIFVVWDEYTPMPTLVIAPTVPPGTSAASAFSHFALLRTTEELLGLPYLGGAAAAPSLRGPFHF